MELLKEVYPHVPTVFLESALQEVDGDVLVALDLLRISVDENDGERTVRIELT
jgi:DMRTA motif